MFFRDFEDGDPQISAINFKQIILEAVTSLFGVVSFDIFFCHCFMTFIQESPNVNFVVFMNKNYRKIDYPIESDRAFRFSVEKKLKCYGEREIQKSFTLTSLLASIITNVLFECMIKQME